MFCKSCGNKIDNDSSYCSFCGIRQSEDYKPINNSPNLTQKETESHPNQSISILRNSDEIPQKDKTITTKNHTEATYLGLLLLAVNIIVGFAIQYVFESDDSVRGFILIVGFGFRILIANWVINIAKLQNREYFGWGLFALFLPTIALIVIGQQKSL